MGRAQIRDDPFRQRRKIILCFDGTGNKFYGTDADSNILKIYRMLDRDNGDKHYYQPGIGTYVKGSLSHTGMIARINSWYSKAKDSAVGTSFDEHVMGAYKFLMSCYEDDDIYFFGFSRGAYVARFLAEMLDHVGLLSQGNEEMARFAWKAFAQWQQRDESTEEEKKKKKEMLDYLQAFRDTFSRPVRRIRFLGLFDTVNSVPRFENAWMQRSKFPYTARSSAKIIRHAVSIDERRAKFRQDLVSGKDPQRAKPQHHHMHSGWGLIPEKANKSRQATKASLNVPEDDREGRRPTMDRFRRPSTYGNAHSTERSRSRRPTAERNRLQEGSKAGLRAQSRDQSPRAPWDPEKKDQDSVRSGASSYLPDHIPTDEEWAMDEAAPQDIEELWFPGCHADLGGGWNLWPDEETSLSHAPLVWMVQEAQQAGLEFDAEKMFALKCCEDPDLVGRNEGNKYDNDIRFPGSSSNGRPPAPDIQITGSSNDNLKNETEIPPPNISSTMTNGADDSGEKAKGNPSDPADPTPFRRALQIAATKGVMHDCLQFHNGLPFSSVLSWKIMEYLPFRRMDLRPDGSWAAISFPLPMGETRDIPPDAKIHVSALERMKANENYRPGNLIVGGGGRGMRIAPKEMGMGKWKCEKGMGEWVGEVWVRDVEATEAEKKKEKIPLDAGEKEKA